MGTCETFDHTADLGLRIRAESLNDLFVSAAEGLFDVILVNRQEVRPELHESIQLSAESPAELLATWLSELIFRFETTHRLYSRFEVEVSPDGCNLIGQLAGEALDTVRHQLDHEVKAVTRHGLFLRPDGSGWLAELILDI
ncbi:archease [Isosphaeraceae bacterium EP7]